MTPPLRAEPLPSPPATHTRPTSPRLHLPFFATGQHEIGSAISESGRRNPRPTPPPNPDHPPSPSSALSVSARLRHRSASPSISDSRSSRPEQQQPRARPDLHLQSATSNPDSTSPRPHPPSLQADHLHHLLISVFPLLPISTSDRSRTRHPFSSNSGRPRSPTRSRAAPSISSPSSPSSLLEQRHVLDYTTFPHLWPVLRPAVPMISFHHDTTLSMPPPTHICAGVVFDAGATVRTYNSLLWSNSAEQLAHAIIVPPS